MIISYKFLNCIFKQNNLDIEDFDVSNLLNQELDTRKYREFDLYCVSKKSESENKIIKLTF